MTYENQLRKAIEQRKRYLIKKLLVIDAYRPADFNGLHKLTLSELEDEWKYFKNRKSEEELG